MSFLKKAISTFMTFILASSSICYVRGYTSGELKALATKLLCMNYSHFLLNPRSYRYLITSAKCDETKVLYSRTLDALDDFEEKYGYNFEDKDFNKYYAELRCIWCEISNIIYRCKQYVRDISPHYFWQEYIFNYPSKLDNILSNMNMAILQADDVNLDLLRNLSVGVVDLDSWVYRFDKNFFKSAWEKGAIQEWVWHLCKRDYEELMDCIKDMDYDEAKKYFDANYDNIDFTKIYIYVLEILKFQYDHLMNNHLINN